MNFFVSNVDSIRFGFVIFSYATKVNFIKSVDIVYFLLKNVKYYAYFVIALELTTGLFKRVTRLT
jgi:hypothetical protein